MTKRKKVLLLEPNYSNKYPPVGLMKIATYYRNRGDWDIVFYKGDLKMFVIERIADKLVDNLNITDISGTDWHLYKNILVEYIKTRKVEFYNKLPIEQSEVRLSLSEQIVEAKDKYWKKTWEKEPEWDRVFVTTLFTFYWDITIETINFAKKLVKKSKNLMVGGVLASIQPKEIEAATGVKPHIGILRPGDLDADDTQAIDELELDYSILDEIEYKYPMANAYYRYTTRGCIRHCAFCAVPTLEPIYQDYIPLKERIDKIKELYGEQKDLLLMDNNVMASSQYERIIQEIIDAGFIKGAKFVQPNILDIAIRNLENNVNDRAYIRKTWSIILDFYNTLKDDEESYDVYCILEKYHIIELLTCKKENLLAAYNELKNIYAKYHHPQGKLRFIDFNQGVDARLFTPEKVELLSKIAIRPLRIAFDDVKTEKKYCEAIRMSVKAGLRDFSNYLLYNFNDHPDDLYYRLRVNVDLSDELGVSIYSFPMKYHPIRKTDDMDKDYSHNRDYIGKHWNRKYIRAVQAVLNSTKGKIGKGTQFFEKAFGKDMDEYHQLLEMPETMIIYRYFFEWLKSPKAHEVAIQLLGSDVICNYSKEAWWNTFQECQNKLHPQDWQNVLDIIHSNNFEECDKIKHLPLAQKLLSFYVDNRKEFLISESDIYKMKEVYDIDPTVPLKRKRKR